MNIYKITTGNAWDGGWDYAYVLHTAHLSEADFKLILANVITFAKLEDRTIDVTEIAKILCEDHGFTSLKDATYLTQSIDKRSWGNNDEDLSI